MSTSKNKKAGRPKPHPKGVKLVLVVLGLLLLTGTILQLNDDMPWLWGGMYALSAGCFFAALSASFSWLISMLWSAILAAGGILQYQREELPFWDNEGCQIGSDVPGILVNFAFSFALSIWLFWRQTDDVSSQE